MKGETSTGKKTSIELLPYVKGKVYVDGGVFTETVLEELRGNEMFCRELSKRTSKKVAAYIRAYHALHDFDDDTQGPAQGILNLKKIPHLNTQRVVARWINSIEQEALKLKAVEYGHEGRLYLKDLSLRKVNQLENKYAIPFDKIDKYLRGFLLQAFQGKRIRETILKCLTEAGVRTPEMHRVLRSLGLPHNFSSKGFPVVAEGGISLGSKKPEGPIRGKKDLKIIA